MPVIELNKRHFRELLSDMPSEYLEWDNVRRIIPMMGASFEREDDETISFEFFPNRPDLYSVEGIANAYRCFVTGKPYPPDRYRLKGESGITVEVDRSVLDVRPYIGGVYVRGVHIDENALRSIMNVQEKLHVTLGRGRKKMAIGVHDASPLRPPFRYLGAEPESTRFLPLQGEREMNLQEILRYHEKGIEYAHTLEGFSRYPLIVDSRGQVLSFPPIINGELTRVTTETEEIFVDCTGTSRRVVEEALNIITAQLIDLGGVAESVEILYPSEAAQEEIEYKSGPHKSPPFKWLELEVSLQKARGLLGVELKAEDAVRALNRMGYPVDLLEGGTLKVKVPPMRVDILHPVDLYEDVAIGYGYNMFAGVLPRSTAIGEELPRREVEERLKELMIGLGYQEVKTLTLVSKPDVDFFKMSEDSGVKIINPLSEEHSTLRPSLIPSLFLFMKNNRHRDLPQRIFEIGEVVRDGVNRVEMWAVALDRRVGFTDCKSLAEYLMRSLGVDVKVERSQEGIFIRGRGAVMRSAEGKVMCEFGEVHPRILERYELTYPAIALRVDVEGLMETVIGPLNPSH